MFWQFKPRFPQRTSLSLEEALKDRRQELAAPGIGEIKILSSWYDELRKRPFNIPRYTAFKGIPVILVFFSTKFVSSPVTIKSVLDSARSWDLASSAFVQDSYPILRLNLRFPDEPSDPLILESPLDVREGDVQVFCEAAMTAKEVQIFITHEQLESGGHYTVLFSAPKLGSTLRSALKIVLKKLSPTASRGDFEQAVKKMEFVFRSPTDGLEGARWARLTPLGKARHPIIDL